MTRSAKTRGTSVRGEATVPVFTVAPGHSFLDALTRALLDGDLPRLGGGAPSPIELTHTTLLVPTRRAERALAQAFLDASGRRAMLLPKVRPISERDEEQALLSDFAMPGDIGRTDIANEILAQVAGIPPAIDGMARLLLLTRLVLEWSHAMRSGADDERGTGASSQIVSAGARTPAQAVHMAQELAQLMDLVETEGKSLDGLDEVVPDSLSGHWKLTLDFLKIITQHWPDLLSELGFISPWERQNRLIRAEAQRILANPPDGPLVVAGVTGSIPATVELMRVVLSLREGAIVLPGLDLDLDEESWQTIVPDHPEHPQFGLKKLLDGLGVDRSDVVALPSGEGDLALRGRATFVSEAMRPSRTTQLWHTFTEGADRGEIARGLDGVSLIEAPSALDEAEAIALMMREVVETPERTAALITPDRMLSRRVGIRLKAWGIDVDDSAGRPFAKTVPGALLDLVIDCVAKDFAPAELMALLKHPLCRIGLEAREIRFAGRALEIAAFRTSYIGRGLDGVEAALERAARERVDGERRGRAVRMLREEDWARARMLVVRLREAFQPLVALYSTGAVHGMRELAGAHLGVAESVCCLPERDGEQGVVGSPLYLREAGAFAASSFSTLLAESDAAPDIAAGDYPDLYRILIGRQNVREHTHVHPRLFIWGPIEARLQRADLVILGSLNDGVWPDSADPGPWLNRPMREQLGLPAPEEGIGRKAHDFVQFLGAREVVMTRAKKIDGVPSVPSRWLMRMTALLDGLDLSDILRPEKPWLAWTRARDHIGGDRKTILMPAPCPPVSARPRRLSVSGVETFLANPYAIFAGKILGLEPLPALGAQPDASLKGAIIHDALARFAHAYPVRLPDDPRGVLLRIATEVLTEYSGHPRVAAFWLPRFERFATWFCESEPERRAGLTKTCAEVSGSLTFEAPAGAFVLSARADRIDVSDAGLILTDYKTGQSPANSKVVSGFAPQLPLEAAIAIAQGFSGIPDVPVRGLRYIRASGAEPPGEQVDIKIDDMSGLAQRTREGVESLVARFDDPLMPYTAVRRSQFSYDYDDFAQLARVAEWSGVFDAGAGA